MTSGLSDQEVDELVDTINQRSPSRQVDVG